MSTSVEAVCVDPAKVNQIWPLVSDLVRSAILKTGLSDFTEVQRSILSGHSLLWLAWNGSKIEGVASTALEKANDKLACTIVACGGNGSERWLGLISSIEQYAKNEGCSSMRIIGRKGWARVLDGYKTKNIILEKALS